MPRKAGLTHAHGTPRSRLTRAVGCSSGLRALVLRSGATIVAIGALVIVPGIAHAQSAADKATARELAAEGIKKFNAGDAEAARTLLEKAQALYDAPIHLLYLARSHEKLGSLVEAAEAYRLLIRAKLHADAPAVFRQAQEDGAKELERLEPRIARLTITVQPEPDGLQVTIDEKPIKTAALSVPRPTNPGTRTVRAEAPGYRAVEKKVDLDEGGEGAVVIELVQAEGEEAAAGRGEDGGAGANGDDLGDGSGAGNEKSGPMGFIVGMRIGGFVPLGELEPQREMAGYWQPGVSGRGEIGFRFARYFGVKGFFGLGEVRPGSELNDFATRQVDRILSKNSAGLTEAGVSILATMDPRTIGGYGEVGFSLLHKYRWSQHLTGPDVDCTNKATYSGFAVRVGGGMNIPVAPIFNIVPAVDVTIGQLGKRTAAYGCEEMIGDFTIGPAADSADERVDSALHYQIFLGVGGDFHFGDGLFR